MPLVTILVMEDGVANAYEHLPPGGTALLAETASLSPKI